MDAIICTIVTLIGASIGWLIVAMISFFDYEVDFDIDFKEGDAEKKE